MLSRVITLLLVLFQLFLSGGGRIYASTCNLPVKTTKQATTLRSSDDDRTPTVGLACLEASDDPQNVVLKYEDVYISVPATPVFSFHVPVSRQIIKPYRARSCITGRALFLMHCNFRV